MALTISAHTIHLAPDPDGVVAQLVERLNGIQEVRGSNPLGSTIRSHHNYRPFPEVLQERKLGVHKDRRYVDEGAKLRIRFGAGRERQHIHEITYQVLAEWVAQQKLWKSANTKIINLSIFSSLWEAVFAEELVEQYMKTDAWRKLLMRVSGHRGERPDGVRRRQGVCG